MSDAVDLGLQLAGFGLFAWIAVALFRVHRVTRLRSFGLASAWAALLGVSFLDLAAAIVLGDYYTPGGWLAYDQFEGLLRVAAVAGLASIVLSGCFGAAAVWFCLCREADDCGLLFGRPGGRWRPRRGSLLRLLAGRVPADLALTHRPSSAPRRYGLQFGAGLAAAGIAGDVWLRLSSRPPAPAANWIEVHTPAMLGAVNAASVACGLALIIGALIYGKRTRVPKYPLGLTESDGSNGRAEISGTRLAGGARAELRWPGVLASPLPEEELSRSALCGGEEDASVAGLGSPGVSPKAGRQGGEDMTSRERIEKALSFEATDRLPKDLGAMRSTGVSAFAYPHLVAALGLPPRRPHVHDTGQMLALPDADVLDALECDVITIDGGVTNAFDEPAKWHEYDFNGRLPALVRSPGSFEALDDGTILQSGSLRMVADSYVFDGEHGGQPILDPDQELPLLDLDQYKRDLAGGALTDEQIGRAADLARRVRQATPRAVFYADHFGSRMGIGNFSGIGVFPMICLLEPDYVRELHEITIEHVLRDVRALLPELAGSVDVVMTHVDDWGTQNTLIAPPEVYRTLFLPYLRRLNEEVHRLAPGVKTFIHTCGAVYDLLDMFVESGFDIINPVQWPAGEHGFREWKDKVRGRATLWGGGVNAQHTLSMGTVDDVVREVSEICRYLREDGGFVFNNIHNLLAEVPAAKIIAMYRTAGEF